MLRSLNLGINQSVLRRRANRKKRRAGILPRRLRLELLEDRHLLANVTWTVLEAT